MRNHHFSKSRFLILFGILAAVFIGIQFIPPQSPDSVFASKVIVTFIAVTSPFYKVIVTFIAVTSPFYIVPLMDWLFPQVPNKDTKDKTE